VTDATTVKIVEETLNKEINGQICDHEEHGVLIP
jgi:hypothetical protein